MATDVTMPRLSDSMEEGTVLKWIVEEGGEVKRGEPLVEIETDKANMTYEADTDGVLIEVVAKEGDTLAIGEVIARIGEAGEAKGGGEAKERSPSPRRRRPPRSRRPRPRSPSRSPRRSRPPPRRPSVPARATARATASASRPPRSRAGWPGSWAWSWRASRARGPAAGS